MIKLLLLLFIISGSAYFFTLPDKSEVTSTVELVDKKIDQPMDTENVEVSNIEVKKINQAKQKSLKNNRIKPVFSDEIFAKFNAADLVLETESKIQLESEKKFDLDNISKTNVDENLDLLASIPLSPAISDEQRNEELQSEQRYQSDSNYAQVVIDPFDTLEAVISDTELPPSEVYLDPEPFELKESERQAFLTEAGNKVKSYQEPLIDPSTGMPENELMLMGDEQEAIEAVVDPGEVL